MPPETVVPGPAAPVPRAGVSRETLIAGAALAAACALAWWWLVTTSSAEAGDMASMHMTSPDPWALSYILPAFAMWAIMMVAMMLPSASPMILLFARMARGPGGAVRTLLFVGAYLAVWTAFSTFAAIAQAGLVASGLVSEMELALGSRQVAGALLIAVGAYQLTPLKNACLAACRSPLSFLVRLWRPGVKGTLRLGVAHGVYCLGCCWGLMLLLFVGGVMNLGWIAALAVLVLAEKVAPLSLRRPIALALICGGIGLIAAGWLG